MKLLSLILRRLFFVSITAAIGSTAPLTQVQGEIKEWFQMNQMSLCSTLPEKTKVTPYERGLIKGLLEEEDQQIGDVQCEYKILPVDYLPYALGETLGNYIVFYILSSSIDLSKVDARGDRKSMNAQNKLRGDIEREITLAKIMSTLREEKVERVCSSFPLNGRHVMTPYEMGLVEGFTSGYRAERRSSFHDDDEEDQDLSMSKCNRKMSSPKEYLPFILGKTLGSSLQASISCNDTEQKILTEIQEVMQTTPPQDSHPESNTAKKTLSNDETTESNQDLLHHQDTSYPPTNISEVCSALPADSEFTPFEKGLVEGFLNVHDTLDEYSQFEYNLPDSIPLHDLIFDDRCKHTLVPEATFRLGVVLGEELLKDMLEFDALWPPANAEEPSTEQSN